MIVATLFDQICVPIITAAVTGAAAIIGRYVLAKTHIDLTAEQRQALETGLENAIGVALSVGQKAGDNFLANHTIKNTALDQAVTYVSAFAPGAIAHFGLSTNDIAQKLDAKLAKLLHVTNTTLAPDATKAEATGALLDNLAKAVTDTKTAVSTVEAEVSAAPAVAATTPIFN